MIDDTIFPRFRESLFKGQYNLLLGAGVSMDSSDRHGKSLPSADQFREGLCTLKDVRKTTSLPLVYSLLEPEEIRRQVVDRFLGCRPGVTVKSLTNFLWRFVYTFNVDDALESAYEASSAKQSLLPLNYDATYDSGSMSLADLRVLHLHGYVKEPDSGFVFSHNEYAKVMKSTNPWMVVLSQTLASEPFIIAGSRLDEPDLEFYLSGRNIHTERSMRGPSLLIEPYPDAVTIKACQVHGLTLVKATLADFLAWVSSIVGNVPGYAARFYDSQSIFGESLDPRKLASFFSDFICVSKDTHSEDQKPDLSFFYGRTPTWNDIEKKVDIEREDTFGLLETSRNLLKESTPNKRLLLITGPAGSGKTTLAKRIAFELLEDGNILLDCRSSARIDADIAIECLSKLTNPFVIFIDNLADHIQQILPILETDRIKQRFLVLGCERDYRSQFVEMVLNEAKNIVKRVTHTSKKERSQLIMTFRRNGLLGNELAAAKPIEFAGQARSEEIAFFVCRLLNDFRPLDRITHSLFDAATKDQQATYAACALAQHCYRVGISYKLLQALNRQESLAQQVSINNPLPLAYNIDNDDYVVPLNLVLADQVILFMAKDHPSTLLEIFIDLAKAIAPHVSRRTIMDKTPEARLAGRLFDADGVVKPLLNKAGADFYTAVHDVCAWNSRYWEQRALYTADDDLRTAVQYARHAVAVEQHPFCYTTLGKLLLREMRTPGANKDYLFAEAFTKLVTAINSEQANSRVSIHPFLTLFTGAISFLEIGGVITSQQMQNLRTHLNFAAFRYRRDRDIQNAVERLEALLPDL